MANNGKTGCAPDVPPEFWLHEDLQATLASRHMGLVIRVYRRHPWHGGRGIGQRQMASWAGISQPRLSRIENGPPIMHLDHLAFWARVLRIPQEWLWFALPAGHPIQPLPASRSGEGLSPGDIGSLLAGLAVGRFPFHWSGDVPGVAALEGMSLVETADELLRVFLQLDDQVGGDGLYLPLSRYVARLGVVADRDPGQGLPALGQLSQLTGWLALDGGDHVAARRYLTSAVHAAHEADTPVLAASSLAYLSLQETYRGHPGPAVALAETAATVGAGWLTPLVRTMVDTRLARAHARLGHHAEAERAIEGAWQSFSRAGTQSEPLWISYVDEIEVSAQVGACYLDLGSSGEARAALTRALSLLERRAPQRLRDRVHYLCRLARCDLLDGEVEQATSTATEALRLNQGIGSARVTERIAEFNDELEPYRSAEAVEQFRAEFAAVSSV
jgi:hypothetical protein